MNYAPYRVSDQLLVIQTLQRALAVMRLSVGPSNYKPILEELKSARIKLARMTSN